eukprot:m.1225 g.1225  ORF g.1225 m.1225 type:complete len:405 (+) comp5903_c0_seq1:2319-3533(+)
MLFLEANSKKPLIFSRLFKNINLMVSQKATQLLEKLGKCYLGLNKLQTATEYFSKALEVYNVCYHPLSQQVIELRRSLAMACSKTDSERAEKELKDILGHFNTVGKMSDKMESMTDLIQFYLTCQQPKMVLSVIDIDQLFGLLTSASAEGDLNLKAACKLSVAVCECFRQLLNYQAMLDVVKRVNDLLAHKCRKGFHRLSAFYVGVFTRIRITAWGAKTVCTKDWLKATTDAAICLEGAITPHCHPEIICLLEAAGILLVRSSDDRLLLDAFLEVKKTFENFQMYRDLHSVHERVLTTFANHCERMQCSELSSMARKAATAVNQVLCDREKAKVRLCLPQKLIEFQPPGRVAGDAQRSVSTSSQGYAVLPRESVMNMEIPQTLEDLVGKDALNDKLKLFEPTSK